MKVQPRPWGTIEATIITVGVVSIFALVSMRGAGTVGADAASLVETGKSLVSLHETGRPCSDRGPWPG